MAYIHADRGIFVGFGRGVGSKEKALAFSFIISFCRGIPFQGKLSFNYIFPMFHGGGRSNVSRRGQGPISPRGCGGRIVYSYIDL